MTPKLDNVRATRTRRRGALWRKQSPVVRVSMRTASAMHSCSGDNIVGLDLDNCRNPATGKIEQWAREIIREANSYSEVTPSGTGVRIFMDGKWRHPEHRTERTGGCRERQPSKSILKWFFAITGDHLRGTPRKIERRSDVYLATTYPLFPPFKTVRLIHHSDGSGGH